MIGMNMSKVLRFDKFKYVDVFQKEISYFLATADILNISKTAESLGIQQSGLSRALHRLEEDLGQKLFSRKNNGLVLTSAGNQFLSAIKETKTNWEKQFQAMMQNSDTPTGLFKIGMNASLATIYLPKIIQGITTKFPQIEIEIHSLPSITVARNIANDDLDFGIVATAIKQPEIVSKNIGEDYLSIYQLTGKLANKTATHLLFNPETQMSNLVTRKFAHLKKVAIKDYDLIAKTAIQTNHLALLPQSVAGHFSQLQQVGGSLSKNKVSLIAHKDKLRSQAYKKIWELIIQNSLY